MKFKTKCPKPNEQRLKQRFLFFPKCINNEYRWLEKATWAQVYVKGYGSGYWADWKWWKEYEN